MGGEGEASAGEDRSKQGSGKTLNINVGVLGHVDSGKTSLGMMLSDTSCTRGRCWWRSGLTVSADTQSVWPLTHCGTLAVSQLAPSQPTYRQPRWTNTPRARSEESHSTSVFPASGCVQRLPELFLCCLWTLTPFPQRRLNCPIALNTSNATSFSLPSLIAQAMHHLFGPSWEGHRSLI